MAPATEPLEGRIGQLSLDTMLRVIGILGCSREDVRVNAGVQIEIEAALRKAIAMASADTERLDFLGRCNAEEA